MSTPAFSIGEWLVCPKCGCTCDAPFHPRDCDVDEPELVLGSTLPQSASVPDGEWQTEVATLCPRCQTELRAEAAFRGRTLYGFRPITTTA